MTDCLRIERLAIARGGKQVVHAHLVLLQVEGAGRVHE